MPRLSLSPRAQTDLVKIWNYIADDNESNADAFVGKLYTALQMLAKQPSVGRRREDIRAGLRSFLVGRYIIFYQSRKATLEISRVLHAARNIAPLFEEN